MAWDVEFTDEFEEWWNHLDEDEQDSIDRKVRLLEAVGPGLGRPHADQIKSSRHQNMKELVIQHAGRPYRVLFAFDPQRCAILLIGGDKTGNARWYEENVPIADDLYDRHLRELEKEVKRRSSKFQKESTTTMTHRNFRELRAKMSPERRARNAAAAREMLEEIALAELREVRHITQEDLAGRLDVDQAAISKMERRRDILLSTLTNVIDAIGGKLVLRVEFANGDAYAVSLAQPKKKERPVAPARG